MLDLAGILVLNKFDKRGSRGRPARRAQAVAAQPPRVHRLGRRGAGVPDDREPVRRPRRDAALRGALSRARPTAGSRAGRSSCRSFPSPTATLPTRGALIPPERTGYLGEIAQQGREIGERIERSAATADTARHCYEALKARRRSAAARAARALSGRGARGRRARAVPGRLQRGARGARQRGRRRCCRKLAGSGSRAITVGDLLLRRARPGGHRRQLPRHAERAARPQDRGAALLRLGRPAPLPRRPRTCRARTRTRPASIPYRRAGEDPIRMFAGRGHARAHEPALPLPLGRASPRVRLSTAFDSVTLYGEDPDPRPDIYGKVGNSGVSIATVDDAKRLYSGFDLCTPSTSVSMTINGPAPIILAFFMNAAIDQQVEKHLRAIGEWDATERRIEAMFPDGARPRYRESLPEGHDGLGLGLLGVSGDQVVDRETYERIKAETLTSVRGTVQADILKEDQAQNTCIFSTEFAHAHDGRRAGVLRRRTACATSTASRSAATTSPRPGRTRSRQLAFTLANGFTIVEYYLARGMAIDDFAPNLSFFFSQRDGPRVRGDRPGGAAHLGPGDARALRRRTAQRRCSSTTSRPRAGACTPRRSTSTTSARRCRRSTRSSTTATACTRTPTTRRSRPRPRSPCAAPSRSS